MHTFSSFSTSSFSILDHFIVNEFLFNRIQCYVTCDEIENQSDHLPLLITLDIDISIVNDVVINPPSTVRVPRQQWDRADITDGANYHDYLDNLLMSLHLPIECINCTDYCCTDYSHIASIQYFHDYLVEPCLEASKVIPVSKTSKKVPGWNEHVEPHKQKSQFWHFIWKECGSPRDGEIAQIMRTTRSRYHYAIRYVKKNEEITRKEAMAKSISENNSRDLWK